jgi:hypothetical protein
MSGKYYMVNAHGHQITFIQGLRAALDLSIEFKKKFGALVTITRCR